MSVPSWGWIVVGIVGAFWLYAVVWALMWAKTRRLYAQMVSYWENKMNFLQIAGRQRHLARTFELARISDLQVRVTSGNAWADINAFENPFVDDPTVKNKIAGSLAAAEQYYRDEVVRCLVPVYWPSVFLKFPEDVLVYFSVDPQTSSRMRIFQAVWTLAGGAGIAAKLRGLF